MTTAACGVVGGQLQAAPFVAGVILYKGDQRLGDEQ